MITFLENDEMDVWYFKVLGVICFLFTVLIAFFLAYSFFFERTHAHNRKKLYFYLEEFGLPDYEGHHLGYGFKIGDYNLEYWNTKRYSLHKNLECVVCNFHAGLKDYQYYKKTMAMLEEKIKGE